MAFNPVLKAIPFTMIKHVTWKFAVLFSKRVLRFGWCLGQSMYQILQLLIIIAVVFGAWFLMTSKLAQEDIVGHHERCKFTFESHIRLRNVTPMVYECPNSGFDIIDHTINMIYIKYMDYYELYGLRCYYKNHTSSTWTSFHMPTIVNSLFVYVKCLRTTAVIYKDVFPLTPLSEDEPAKEYVYLDSNGKAIPGGGNTTRISSPSRKKHSHLNILLITLKSVSKNAFLRSMPLTRRFLEKRQSILFTHLLSKGVYYMDSFMSLLRNCSVTVNPSCKIKNTSYIWQPYQTAKYYTMYIEDSQRNAIIPMNEALPDLDYRWTDYPFIERFGNHWMNDQPYCLKDRKYHEVLLKLLLDFCQSKKRLFAWVSFNFGSVSESPLSTLDVHIADFLQKLNATNLIDRYAIVLLSDNGRLSGAYGDVIDHYIERFNPIAHLSLPRWFHQAYPAMHKALGVMSTNLVDHNFFHDLIVSLVRPVQLQKPPLYFNYTRRRNWPHYDGIHWLCPEYFPMELCPCKYTQIKWNSAYMERLADYVLRHVNDYFATHRSIAAHCARLARGRILAANYINALQTYKIRFAVFIGDVYDPTQVFEAYVQVTNRRPGLWKCYRLTYQPQHLKKLCLSHINNLMKPFCFC